MHMDVADAINVMLYASDRPRPQSKQAIRTPPPANHSEPGEAGPSEHQSNGDHDPLDAVITDLAPSDIPSTEGYAEPPKDITEYNAPAGPSLSELAGETPKAPTETISAIEEKSSEPAEPGCAVWDIFRAEDADKIRSFLKSRFDRDFAFSDPIHSQLFYLDAGLRKELWETKNVASFRIYQYPVSQPSTHTGEIELINQGQAVFIPAGCAHQVCNLADCIKIALDFVSPRESSLRSSEHLLIM